MASEQDLQHLHDKATRGLALAEEEQARLAARYAELDSQEAIALSEAPRPQSATALQVQIEAITSQILSVTLRIQATAAANDRLRREIAALQEQAAQRLKAEPA
jgi:hypothetical protein